MKCYLLFRTGKLKKSVEFTRFRSYFRIPSVNSVSFFTRKGWSEFNQAAKHNFITESALLNEILENQLWLCLVTRLAIH